MLGVDRWGLVVFEQWQPIWWLGVLVFTVGIPINLAALQVLWLQKVSGPDQPRCFAVRLTLETWARLVGFLGLAALVDGLIRPALSWPIWPVWLLLLTGVRQAAALVRSSP